MTDQVGVDAAALAERSEPPARPLVRPAILWLLAAAVAIVAPFVVPGFTLFQLSLVMVYAIAVLGLNILTGFTGQFSLGHSAFFAFGAYVAAIAIEHFGVNYIPTPFIAGLCCFVLGYLVGIPASRLAGVYLALSTFALAVATPSLLKLSVIQDYTGGVQGLYILPPPTPPFLPISSDQWLYFFVLGWLALFFVLAFNLLKSRSGRAMLAVRENEIAAKAAGINTVQIKAYSFALSAFYTGAAGALGALVVHYIAPESYTFFFAIVLLIGLVVGGVGSIPGTIVGAAFILFVPNFAGDLSKTLSGAAYGLALLGFIYLMPEGAAGAARHLSRRMRNSIQARRNK